MNQQTPNVADVDDEARFLRTEFLERVAHEIRGPVGVTMGALDELEMELRDGAASGDDARVASMLAMARRGLRKLLRTADRLSRAAQLESGDVSLSRTSLDLRVVVERAIQDATSTEGRGSIRITTELPDAPFMTEIDGAWMGAAIAELIGHSIRAAQRSVRVAIENVEDRVCVSVTDDRVIAPEPVRRRFSRNAPRRDVGLDLPLVHDVVRLHAWDIELDDQRASEPTAGARGGVSVRLYVTRRAS